MVSQGFFVLLFVVCILFAIWYLLSYRAQKNSGSMLDVTKDPRDLKYWSEQSGDAAFSNDRKASNVEDDDPFKEGEVFHGPERVRRLMKDGTIQAGSRDPLATKVGKALQDEIHRQPEKYSRKTVEKIKKNSVQPQKPEDHRLQSAKSLNILFNYNGHTWDAYEVLGAPAGASLQMVTKYYQQALIQADPQSRDFLESAYQAILKKY